MKSFLVLQFYFNIIYFVKNFVVFLLLIIFSFLQISCKEIKAHNPYEEINTEKRLTENEKLVAIAKVWGFLKYYHPQVAKGNYNWDEQLFAVMEKAERVKTSKELSEILNNWVKSLGEVETCSKCFQIIQEEEFLKNFNLTWIDSGFFSQKLSENLTHIKKNRVQDYQHYVTTSKAGNIIVQNEPEYEYFNWEERELRLLSLFRYWNQVEYFFPYKYQMDQDWDKTLEILLPKFQNVQNEQEYHLAMLELVVSIDDSHAYLVTEHTNQYFGYYWAPVKMEMIDGKAVVTGVYDKTKAMEDDWQVGDILTAVDGVLISVIVEGDRKYLYGSNNAAKYRNIEISLLNGSTTSADIEFLRDGKIQTKQIKRYLKSEFSQEKPVEPKWKFHEKKIGYVNMGLIENQDVKQMMNELKNTKAIIFDIRNYPKGTLYSIANEINIEDRPFVKFIVPDLNYPGKYTWIESLSAGRKNAEAYQGKIILLVNELTQSHAEFTAMALQTASDVTVVGSQTSGADGNVSDVSFLAKFRTYMTGIGVFYPDGRKTQRIGIVPDIEVKKTLEGIKQGTDEVLEKALEVAQGKTS